MIKIEFTDTEWKHMVSVIHFDSLKGDKQSERLLQKLLQRRNEQQDYQCGDDCKGECSGEVDGFVHCPEEHNKEVRDKVLDEVIEKWREWHHAGYERPIQRETVVKLFEELRQAGEP